MLKWLATQALMMILCLPLCQLTSSVLLFRLPKLEDLRLNVTTPAEPTAMAMLFGSMRTFLTGLHGLTWQLRKPWHKAAAAWQELAFHSQLTELVVEYNMSVSSDAVRHASRFHYQSWQRWLPQVALCMLHANELTPTYGSTCVLVDVAAPSLTLVCHAWVLMPPATFWCSKQPNNCESSLSWMCCLCLQEGVPFSYEELAPLSKLNSLQRFKLAPQKWLPDILPAEAAEAADSDWLQCLAGMTALTVLTVLVPQPGGLRHVNSCSGLADVELIAYQAGTALGDAGWEPIGQLTRLTRLSTATQAGHAAPASCLAALSNLQRLRLAGLSGWTAEALPVLHMLTCLNMISGNWLPTPANMVVCAKQSCHSCPHVRQVQSCSGPVPFAAFPNVELVTQVGAFDFASVVALGDHCQNLREFVMDCPVANVWGAPAAASMTLSILEPVVARVAALKSPAKLHKLVTMGFKPSSNDELAAVVEVVQQLQAHRLRHVGIGLEPGCTVDVVGLILLGRLSGLSQLDIMDSTARSVVAACPGHFIYAMSGVARVNVRVPQEDVPMMNTKYNELVATGLAVPKALYAYA